MNRDQRMRLAGHLAQARIVRMAQVAILAVSAVGLLRYGLPSLLAGLLVAWLFGAAMPKPTAEFDRLTRRRG